MPSGLALPRGSEARNELQWNTGTEEWDAVASVETVYGGLTRAADFASIKTALLHLFEQGGTKFPAARTTTTEPFSASIGTRPSFSESDQSHQIFNVWLDGGDAPFAWVLTPAQTDWVDGFWLRYERKEEAISFLPIQHDVRPLSNVVRDFLEVNGAPYDLGYAEVPAERPAETGTADNDRASINLIYTAPAQTANEITEVV